jgi:putative redox protein
MEAKVTWHAGLSFTGTAGSGFELPLGTDPAVGGANDGFRPMELMAISLAGCTGMDVISILHKKKQQVTAFEVSVRAEQAAEHPHVFNRAAVIYRVTGHGVDEKAVLRAIELSATKYCPAQAMLGKVVPLDLLYEIYEEAEEKRLVTQGRFQPQKI